MKRARGFTLIELAVVLTLIGLTSGAIGHLYLETRVAGVQIEAQVSLERRASLVLERVARDLRGGHLTSTEGGLTIDTPDGPVRYEAQDGLLTRRGPDGLRTLAPHAFSLTAQVVEGGHRVEVRLRRPLIRSRRVEVVRRVFVGARR